MDVTTFPTAAEFLAAVGPTLSRHEAEHHLVLGVAEAIAGSAAPNGDLWAAAVTEHDGLVAAAVMSGNRPVLIASDRESLADAAPLLCNMVEQAGRNPSHAIGAVGQVEAFAAEWGRRTQHTPRVAMRQRVYKLTAVDPAPATSGALRVATMDDIDLVADWVAAFEQEALTMIVPQSPRAVAVRRVAAGEVYLWCDPEPRTMAGSARPTKRAIAVNAVYTPPEWRRRGYATACVAGLSTLLLAQGYEFCVLYTDLANPTSNAIYSRIGYRPVRDFLMYELGSRVAGGG
jgi:predicted GNAT family acetyltransferase